MDTPRVATSGAPVTPSPGTVHAPPRERADILAVERTQMASERTLMAWIRTAISMISFGFTIYKALQYIAEEGVVKPIHPAGPRNLGLALVSMGVIALVFASVQHLNELRRFRAILGGTSWSLSLTMGALIIILGLLVILNIVFRLGPF